MVMLARTTYNDAPDHDPRELLDTHRFPTDDDLEEHLLYSYLATRYDRHDHRTRRPDWAPENARHWLGYLATHLTKHNTHDLTWWQLPATLHRYTRILLTTTTVGLAAGLLFGLVSGLVSGLVFGLINETGFTRGRAGREPERLRLRVPRRGSAKRSSATYLKRFAIEFTGGFAAGLAAGLANGLANGLAAGLAAGLAVGLAVGLVNVVVSVLGDSHDPHATNPWTLLTRDRTVTLVRTIAAGLAVGLVFGLVSGLVFGLVSVFGLVFGLVGATARLALSAWGNWLLFTRLWLPLTGRLPWRPKRFLEDAYRRGVLRRAGAVYQFRHARLRDHLATHYRAKPDSR